MSTRAAIATYKIVYGHPGEALKQYAESRPRRDRLHT